MRFLSSFKLSEHRYKTSEGYLVCLDCLLAKVGKQQYYMSELFQDINKEDDKLVDVDRREQDVFNDKTMASFENKPLVDEHPHEDVNVDNYKDYAVGFVRDIHKGEFEGQPVMVGNIIVTDKDVIDEIESGEKVELSCGYECDILGEEPNFYQANIRGNHVALCKEGRAGIAKIQDSKIEDEKYKGIDIVRGRNNSAFFYKIDGKMYSADTLKEAEEDIDEMLEELRDKTYVIFYANSINKGSKYEVQAKNPQEAIKKAKKDLKGEFRYYIDIIKKDSIKDVDTLNEQKKDLEKNLKNFKEDNKIMNFMNETQFDKKDVEKVINNLGYKVKEWYIFNKNTFAVIDPKEIKLDGYTYFDQQVRKLQKYGFAKDVYADDNEIIFYDAKFNIKDSVEDASLKNEILKVGQKVHLEPSKNKNLGEEFLNDVYEVVGFKYKGANVKEDPTINNPEVRDISTVIIKSKKSNNLYNVNRFQLKDSLDDSIINLTNDTLENKPVKVLIQFDDEDEAKEALKSLQRKRDFMDSELIYDDTILVHTTDVLVDDLKKALHFFFVKNIKIKDSIEVTSDSKKNDAKKLMNIVNIYNKIKSDK